MGRALPLLRRKGFTRASCGQGRYGRGGLKPATPMKVLHRSRRLPHRSRRLPHRSGRLPHRSGRLQPPLMPLHPFSFPHSRARKSAKPYGARSQKASASSKSSRRAFHQKASFRPNWPQPAARGGRFCSRPSQAARGSTRRSPRGATSMCFAMPTKSGSATSRPTACSTR